MLVIADTMSDIVGQWDVSLSNGVHHIEFEHGTTSGKRIIRIDGKVCVTQHCSLENIVTAYSGIILVWLTCETPAVGGLIVCV